MARIEDYALIGDTQTGALVSNQGSIDWLCLPRFDSGACFAALLGDRRHGRWQIAPAGEVVRVSRRYRGPSLILETEFTTATGSVRLIDFMPPRGHEPDVVRIVEGIDGTVAMTLDLVVRFDYGAVVPWVRRIDSDWTAIAGPDSLSLRTPVELRGVDLATASEFEVHAGDRVPFVLTWHPSHESAKMIPDPFAALDDTLDWWNVWTRAFKYEGDHKEQVLRSAITLKALTFAPTGGIVAALTTSLPERIGGVRNWDYRFCWLRDATFTLLSLIHCGFLTEAAAWRNWLLRAAAGDPSKLQTMYGASGERRLPELILDWLPGYEGSVPVRIGNAAVTQFQLDVYGEVIDALHVARLAGLDLDASAWALEKVILDFIERVWQQPDEGIWEVRGPRRHFTHSKVLAWVAFDRAIKSAERFGLGGPVDRWRAVRQQIHDEVCRQGYNASCRAFTQYYGSEDVDASLLQIPLVGFLPIDDPRVTSTIAAIEEHLMLDGFVRRYLTHGDVDGLPEGEGAFLACSFWLADAYTLQGRRADAEALFARLLSLTNDVGLLAEQYEAGASRQLGNFPQAFSHVSLINTARNLANTGGPAKERSRGAEPDVAFGAQPPASSASFERDSRSRDHAG